MASGFSEPLEQFAKVFVRWRGRKLLYFGGCDYLRLSSHPAILQAVQSTARRYGLTVAASRRTTGNHVLYERLEDAARRFFTAERAIFVPNGYLTNIAVAQGLEGTFDRVFIDARAHSSLRDAVGFLGSRSISFAHRDPADLQARIRSSSSSKSIAVLTDGMFAQDGTVPPLAAYREVCGPEALLWVDDAHAGGVLGSGGRGSIELAGISRRNAIQTVTFSKAFGVYGGAILCDRARAKLIVARSSALAGSTPVPLPLAAGVISAIKIQRETPALRERLMRNIEAFWKEMGRRPGIYAPIISVGTRNPAALKSRLLKAGIYPCFIEYGGGPFSPYFRFAISSEHTLPQIKKLARILAASSENQSNRRNSLLFLGLDV